MRTLSIISYLFIFLQGSMIILPFGCLLVTGIFDAEPIMKFFIALADITLLFLLIISNKKRRNSTLFLELLSFILLLLPLIHLLLSFSFKWFNYFLFLFPTACFIILFLLSIFLRERNFRREGKVVQ